MGRPRRTITDDGKVLCSLCKEWVDIEGYSTRKLLGGDEDHIDDIWYERDGRLFGKPQGYCKVCMRAATHSKGAMERRRQEAADARNAENAKFAEEATMWPDRIYDIERAHYKGIFLNTRWHTDKYGLDYWDTH
jgi:hypothetical protein